MRDALTLVIAWAALGQNGWLAVYASGPWRDTPIGWVWLFKGGCLAFILDLLLFDRLFLPVPDFAWVLTMCLLAVSIWVWFLTTLRAKRSDFLP